MSEKDNVISIHKHPRILVAAPQHVSKNYCFDEWAENVKNFTYPNFDVFLADNSPDSSNSRLISEKGFAVQYIPDEGKTLLERINDGHEACRVYALENGYDAMLHLETDIIPPIDVIERLLAHQVSVVNGVYDIFYGKRRKAMIQVDEQYDKSKRAFRSVEFLEETEPVFFSGALEKVYHAGIGCSLIRSSVLEMIPFRVVEGNSSHSDTWFAHDCYRNNISIYVDTDVICEHRNSTWLGVKDQILGT